MNDQQFLSALDSIDKELSVPKPDGPIGADLCATYKKIRGFLESILPLIKLIPVWGDKLASAIKFLMTLADTVCPA